jgi:transposase InsO family protein
MSKNQVYLCFQEVYYRTNLEKEIGDLVAQCFFCTTETAKRRRNHLAFTRPLPSKPREAWSLDLAGGFGRTNEQYNSVLVCVDEVSLFTLLLPLRSKKGAELANVFENHIIRAFHPPIRIFSDQEGGLTSDHFQAMLNRYHIDHHTTARYSPASNGLAERYIAKCKQSIRTYCRETATRSWVESCALFGIAINRTPLSLSKADLVITPERVMYGYALKTPFDLLTFDAMPDDPVQFYKVVSENANRYAKLLTETRTRTRVQKIDSLNKSRQQKKFAVDEIVFARTKPISSQSALAPKYDGPYTVTEVGNATAVLEPLSGGQAITASFSHIYKSAKIPGTDNHHPFIPDDLKRLLA